MGLSIHCIVNGTCYLAWALLMITGMGVQGGELASRVMVGVVATGSCSSAGGAKLLAVIDRFYGSSAVDVYGLYNCRALIPSAPPTSAYTIHIYFNSASKKLKSIRSSSSALIRNFNAPSPTTGPPSWCSSFGTPSNNICAQFVEAAGGGRSLLYGKASLWDRPPMCISNCLMDPMGPGSPCSTSSTCQTTRDCMDGPQCMCASGYTGAGIGPGGCYGKSIMQSRNFISYVCLKAHMQPMQALLSLSQLICLLFDVCSIYCLKQHECQVTDWRRTST